MATGSPQTSTVMSAADIDRALTRIAHELVEAQRGVDELILLGIPSRGVPLAQALSERLSCIDPAFDPDSCLGSLDITMYRDDLGSRAARVPEPTRVPARGVDDVVVVLVDDVLYSGRTVRAALDALSDLGRPRAVRLAVLVDRGHRELPIRADHVGKNLPTSRSERVTVRLSAVDGVAEAEQSVVIDRAAAAGEDS